MARKARIGYKMLIEMGLGLPPLGYPRPGLYRIGKLVLKRDFAYVEFEKELESIPFVRAKSLDWRSWRYACHRSYRISSLSFLNAITVLQKLIRMNV